jgi:hypothetical protein
MSHHRPIFLHIARRKPWFDGMLRKCPKMSHVLSKMGHLSYYCPDSGPLASLSCQAPKSKPRRPRRIAGDCEVRDINQISAQIIDAAMKVDSALGPGLLVNRLEPSASLRALRGEADDLSEGKPARPYQVRRRAACGAPRPIRESTVSPPPGRHAGGTAPPRRRRDATRPPGFSLRIPANPATASLSKNGTPMEPPTIRQTLGRAACSRIKAQAASPGKWTARQTSG